MASKLSYRTAALFICDIQERFGSTIFSFPDVVRTAAKMVTLRSSLLLTDFRVRWAQRKHSICQSMLRNKYDISVYNIRNLYEKYVKAFGKTVSDLPVTDATLVKEKTCFSMCSGDILEHLSKNYPSRRDVIITGIEVTLMIFIV